VTSQPTPFGPATLNLEFASSKCLQSKFSRPGSLARKEIFASLFGALLFLTFLYRQFRALSIHPPDYPAEISNRTHLTGSSADLNMHSDMVSADTLHPPIHICGLAQLSTGSLTSLPYTEAICINAGPLIGPTAPTNFTTHQPHRCLVCDTPCAQSCCFCDQDFCSSHLYPCADCDIQCCGSCLDDHHSDGHWSDSDTSAQLARSQHLSVGQSGPASVITCSHRGNAGLSRKALATTFVSLCVFVFPKCIAIQPEPCI